MNPPEIRAYNAGVSTVLDLVASAAAIVQTKPWKPTREGAVEALEEFTAVGEALLMELPEVSPLASSKFVSAHDV